MDREALQRAFHEANVMYENSLVLAERAAKIRDNDEERLNKIQSSLIDWLIRDSQSDAKDE